MSASFHEVAIMLERTLANVRASIEADRWLAARDYTYTAEMHLNDLQRRRRTDVVICSPRNANSMADNMATVNSRVRDLDSFVRGKSAALALLCANEAAEALSGVQFLLEFEHVDVYPVPVMP